MKQLERLINQLVRGVGAFCAGALILLMMVVAFNAIARYGFSYIVIGLEEMTWHLNAVVFMLGMSYSLHTGHHVRVDIIYQSLSTKHKAWIDLIGTLLFILPFSLIIMYYGWDFMAQAYQIGERSEHPTGLPYRFIIKGLVFASFSTLLLASLSFIIHKVQLLRGATQPSNMDQVVH